MDHFEPDILFKYTVDILINAHKYFQQLKIVIYAAILTTPPNNNNVAYFYSTLPCK